MIKTIPTIQESRDQRAVELFGMIEARLSKKEIEILNQYIHDYYNPEWRQIVIQGIKTNYEVNNVGDVRNTKTGKMMGKYKHYKGYLTTMINVAGHPEISKSYFIHRLVLLMFTPNPDDKPQINHITGIKTCNWLGNLEWNTPKENVQHAIANNLFYKGTGEDANSSKYKNHEIHRVCELLETGKLTNVEIEKLTGVDRAMISKIKCGEYWKEISSQYKIKKPVQNATGEAAAASKYTEKQIREVCELLQNPLLKMSNIARMTGVSHDMVRCVKVGKNWKEISSQYNIPGLKEKLDENSK